MMERRTLGNTDIHISPVALGCWPMTGMTSPGATKEGGLAAIRACFDLGINHLDTAYMYGAGGESERFIAEALGPRRDEMVVATKGGLHWKDGERIHDASCATLRRECEESLRRLQTDRVEVYYLHAPDPKVPVAESAGELKRLLDEGKTRGVGVSNLSVEQLEAFAAECPIAVCQPPYSMLQRDIEADVLPWCRARGVSVACYWPLMKGLLAGRLPRDHVFDRDDSRRKYPMFRGEEWQKSHDMLDKLRPIAEECGRTLVQLVVNWTIHQPGVTAAVCGAKRPEQIAETAGGAGWRLTEDQMARINRAIEERGETSSIPPV